MSVRLAGLLGVVGVLAALPAGCGGGGDAEAAGSAPPGPVYTSEVQSVSRWVRPGGTGIDTTGLVARQNPRGEGVLVYAPGEKSASGEQAVWMVVDSQVVPLTGAARRATPELAESRMDAPTRQKTGIASSEGEAGVREIVRQAEAAPAPAREAPARQAQAQAQPADSAAQKGGEPELLGKPVRAPAAQPPRRQAPKDTLHLGGPASDSAAAARARTDAKGKPARPARPPAADTGSGPAPADTGSVAPAA